jgi:hypothetical protein
MGKIVAINKSKTVSYKDDTIEYFEEVNSLSKKESYQNIIDKIKNATSTVRIASTSNISEKILDAIHENLEINAYIILKSLSKSKKTEERFDERRVSIIREVDELENNFILIDNKAYLFINPLNEEQNISHYFDESKTSDLEFIFNYYFWNRASQEKLLNTINKAIESPFPPFELRKQKFINVIDSGDEKYVSLYVPRDKKFNETLDKNASKKYFSDDLIVPLYLNEHSFTVGLFAVNEAFSVENSWELKKSKLEDIDSSLEIVPRKESWSNSIKIKESRGIELDKIISPSIKSMENQKPKGYPIEKYVKEVIYTWVVVPPHKPKNAKKSSLYNEHKMYEEKKNKWKEEKVKNTKLLNEKKKELSVLDKKDEKYKKKMKNIENEIKKVEDKLNQQVNIDEPKYKLPESGTLYETNKEYFLEIIGKEELESAENYIQKCNFEKECVMVV